MKTGALNKVFFASLAFMVAVLSASPAFADWHGRGDWGGPHIGISLGYYGYNPYYGSYYGPGYYGYPAYYAPPPTVVYEQAPQVVYAPAPTTTYVQPAPAYAQPAPAPAQAAPPAGNSAYPGYFGQ